MEEFYDSLEELYKKHVVEFENTDDDYRKKAAQVYDACTSFGERWWDNIVRKTKFFLDIHRGTAKAAIDFVSGIFGLAFMLLKITGALSVAVVTMPFGITPQWVKDTGKEAMELVLGIAQILKNPGRALAALGQKATDTVEEKGIPYAVSYAIADIVIAILVDKGIKKLRGLDKADNLSKVGTKMDDAVNVADEIGAGAGAIEGGTTAKGLTGHGLEDYLTNNIGGDGSFSVGGREFDGGTGSRWWEAKSGDYWKMLEENPNKLAKFKSDMGDRLRIATENGASYELFSNTPIPESIKQWLTKKGIHFTELLD